MIDMITRHTGFLITPDGKARGRNHDFNLPPGATTTEIRDRARALEVPGDRLTSDQIARASWLVAAPEEGQKPYLPPRRQYLRHHRIPARCRNLAGEADVSFGPVGPDDRLYRPFAADPVVRPARPTARLGLGVAELQPDPVLFPDEFSRHRNESAPVTLGGSLEIIGRHGRPAKG